MAVGKPNRAIARVTAVAIGVALTATACGASWSGDGGNSSASTDRHLPIAFETAPRPSTTVPATAAGTDASGAPASDAETTTAPGPATIPLGTAPAAPTALAPPTPPPTTAPRLDPGLAVLRALAAADGGVQWTAQVGSGAIGPVAPDGALLLAQGGSSCAAGPGAVTAFDTASGQARWTRPVYVGDLGGAFQPLRADAGLVVVQESVAVPTAGTGTGSDEPVASFTGLDAASGQQRWRASTFAGPWTDTGSLLLVAGFAGLAAIDRGTGASKWLAPSVLAVAPAADAADAYRLVQTPGTTAGTVTVQVAATDLRTGKEGWRTPVGPATQYLPLRVESGVVIVSGAGGTDPPFVAGFDAVTGKERWRWKAQPGPAPTRFATGAGKVFVVAGDKLLALDARTGKQRWTAPAASFGKPGEQWDVAAGGSNAYVLVVDQVVALDAGTGKQAWAAPVRKATTVSVWGPTAYVSSVGRLAGTCG